MNAIKSPLLSVLEKEAVKVALANLVTSPWLFDFRTWAVRWAVDYAIKDLAKPVVDYFFMKIGLKYEVIDGKHLLNEINKAANTTEWDAASSRV